MSLDQATLTGGDRSPVAARRWANVVAGARRLGGIAIALVLVMLIFAQMNSAFATSGNLLELLRSMSSLAIVALGLTLVIVAGEIDLSVGATYGLGAMTTGITWTSGMPLPLALAVGLLAGAGVGLVNGLLTTYGRIPSFIVTLGSLNLVQGLTLYVSKAQGVTTSSGDSPPSDSAVSDFRSLASTVLPFDIPIQVLWMLSIAVLVALLLHKSIFGFRLSAMGGNVEAARVIGLHVTRYKIVVFVISGFLAALAGILDFSFLGSTDPTSGSQLTFPVFAAVIIGGASLSGGRGTVIGTLSGALLLATLTNGLALLGVGPYAQLMLVGFVTIAAVGLDRWTNGRK